jgi:hypothetical protein
MFCSRKNINKVVVYSQLNPQPTEVLTLNRYYIKLKGNSEYKRKVTLIIRAPERLEEIRT